MNHYGYFGAAVPGSPTLSLRFDRGEFAERAQRWREQEHAPEFGTKCPELVALSAEARELAGYLYNGWDDLTQSGTTWKRLEQVVRPIDDFRELTIRRIAELSARKSHYDWLLRLFPRRYRTATEELARADAALTSATQVMTELLYGLQGIIGGVKDGATSALTGTPWIRSTVLRWCHNARSYIPMERDICSDFRTRREMLKGATSTYRKWDKTCDRLVQYNRRTGALGTKFNWPRPLDESGCESGLERWDGLSAGCNIPSALKTYPHAVKTYREGCYITEQCWDRFGWNNILTVRMDNADDLRRISDDEPMPGRSYGHLYLMLSQLKTAAEAVEAAADELGVALNDAHKKAKRARPWILGSSALATLGMALPMATSLYNQGLKKIKESENDCKELERKAVRTVADMMELYALKFGTVGGPFSSASRPYSRRYGFTGAEPVRGWRIVNEYIAEDLGYVVQRMKEITDSMRTTCEDVYVSRTTAQWEALGVPAQCTLPITSYRPGPRPILKRRWDDDEDDERVPTSGGKPPIARTEGLYGGYGLSTLPPPKKYLGLERHQWLMVGAVGAVLYYFKGRE